MTESFTLRSADGSTVAELIPSLNMLCCSLRYDGTELLDQTHGVEAYRERGATLGVPLLHPWANRLEGFAYDGGGKHVELSDEARIPRDPNGLPIHGVQPALLRFAPEHEEATDSLTAVLEFSTPELLELFPFEHQLRTTVAVGAGRLTIATTLRATGADSVPVSFGYHPYLRLPGGDRESWQVELGASARLVLDEHLIPTGERETIDQPSFTLEQRSLDDGLAGLGRPASFSAASEHGTVTVEFHRGYPYAQVYAPPGNDFICFEPMTAPANALRSGDGLTLVAPGDEYAAEFSLAFVGV